jgi:hypothetical protein
MKDIVAFPKQSISTQTEVEEEPVEWASKLKL